MPTATIQQDKIINTSLLHILIQKKTQKTDNQYFTKNNYYSVRNKQNFHIIYFYNKFEFITFLTIEITN